MERTMYDTLLQLPLFQGLGQADITAIIEKVKTHFVKPEDGEVYIRQGELCDKLVFLLSGQLLLTRNHNDNLFAWYETMNNPQLIEPHSLFGIRPQYTATYTAQSKVHLLTIDKSYVLSELNNYEVFRLNYLNILSSRAQLFQSKLWSAQAKGTEQKIINFFLLHSDKPAGKKVIQIKMEDFASLLDDTRLNISKALNSFQEEGLLVLRRKEIEVPNLAPLVEYTKRKKKRV